MVAIFLFKNNNKSVIINLVKYMLKKNDVIDVEIIDMGCNMEGVAKYEGIVLFVPYAIVGEKVRVKIINTKQKAYICKVLEVLKTSPYREIPRCPYFMKCGGCQSQHINYDKTLEFKTLQVQNAVYHIAKENIVVSDCVSSDKKYRYRNKLALPINPNTKKVGMFREYSHEIIDICDCLIQEGWAKTLINCVNTYIERSGVSVYDEKTCRGVLRHIVARHYDGRYLFTMVVNGRDLPHVDVLIDLLKISFDDFGLSININIEKSNVIMTQNFVHVYGIRDIDIFEFGVKYSINNASFMQVNNDIKGKIYSAVLNELSSDDVVIDAYSGAGLLTAMCSKKCKYAYGIEIVKSAVESADNLMKSNNIHNMKNYCGDSAVILPQLIKGIDGEKVVVLDPPRKGCHKSVMETIGKNKPSKILYISCNPSTLARDIFNLKQVCKEYVVKKVVPFDMFPCTKHVETFAVIELKQ